MGGGRWSPLALNEMSGPPRFLLIVIFSPGLFKIKKGGTEKAVENKAVGAVLDTRPDRRPVMNRLLIGG